MKTTHYIFSIALAVSVSGCGTINTVLRGDEVTRSNLKKWGTYCDSLPRVYSGVFYNLCILHGPADTVVKDLTSPLLFPIPIIDSIPSGVLDTLFLPYTIYRQSADGSIALGH